MMGGNELAVSPILTTSADPNKLFEDPDEPSAAANNAMPDRTDKALGSSPNPN